MPGRCNQNIPISNDACITIAGVSERMRSRCSCTSDKIHVLPLMTILSVALGGLHCGYDRIRSRVQMRETGMRKPRNANVSIGRDYFQLLERWSFVGSRFSLLLLTIRDSRAGNNTRLRVYKVQRQAHKLKRTSVRFRKYQKLWNTGKYNPSPFVPKIVSQFRIKNISEMKFLEKFQRYPYSSFLMAR